MIFNRLIEVMDKSESNFGELPLTTEVLLIVEKAYGGKEKFKKLRGHQEGFRQFLKRERLAK